MPLRLFSWIGLALTAAGCCSHDAASSNDTSAKSAETECKTGECCSSVSRSSLLMKSAKTQDAAKTSEETK